VFGASGGIGSALSELLAARAGAQLLLSGRDGGKLAAVQGRAGAAAAVSIAAADPCDPKAVEDVVGEAVKLYGRVDGVANCVGSVILKPGAPGLDLLRRLLRHSVCI
jgi:NAD(P)-dependent dehydrogenase (short-subunit alcohol dehydrogenase family)